MVRGHTAEARFAIAASTLGGFGMLVLGGLGRLDDTLNPQQWAQVLTGCALGTLAVLGLAWIQLDHHRSPTGSVQRVGLLVMVTGVLPVLFGSPVNGVPQAIAVALVLMRWPAALASIAAMTGLVASTFGQLQEWTDVSLGGVLVQLVMTGLVLTALTRLALLVDELHLTRVMVARQQVDLERERVVRDLHDMIGRTLVATSLRNQAVLTMLGNQHPEVSATLNQLHDTIFRGQRQLRALTSGPTLTTIAEELGVAHMLCQQVGVDLTTELAEVPEAQERLVALTIREGVTNLLKHARPSHAVVTVNTDEQGIQVLIANDGSRVASGEVPQRLAQALSRFDAHARVDVTDGWYRMRVEIPAPGAPR